MTTYRLMDGVAGRPGTGSSGTQPPADGVSYSGSVVSGIAFTVSQPMWLEGYWYWVPGGTNPGPVIAQEFALWSFNTTISVTLIDAGTVTSGTLTAGEFNYVPLSAPVQLAPGYAYIAATGVNGNFPSSSGQFGSGDPYSAGIVNGPLSAYSDQPGSYPCYGGELPQGLYSTADPGDPAADCPLTGFNSQNLWIDVQVTDQAPGGVSFRGWPNVPLLYNSGLQSGGYTLGMEFSLSQGCTLDAIWHYSMTGSVALPARCGIWNVAAETEVAGTDNSSPSWLLPGGSPASAGDGWVYCDYSGAGVTLSSGVNYKVSTFYGGAGDWFGTTDPYWSGGYPGGSGFTAGPLMIPDNADATPGQNSWNYGITWAYPDTSSAPEMDWIDVEVTPASAPPPSGPAYAAFMSSM